MPSSTINSKKTAPRSDQSKVGQIVIGHVGAFKPHSWGDKSRLTTAIHWLVKKGRANHEKVKHDEINLYYGRDFLVEDLKYDIVILHDVYRIKEAPKLVGLLRRKQRMQIQTSEYHTPALWRGRLRRTGAYYIFVFQTAPLCLGVDDIGDIRGYKVTKELLEWDDRVMDAKEHYGFAVYERLT